MTTPIGTGLHRGTLLMAAVLGLTGVALGAWAAHGLETPLASIYGDRMVEVGGREVLAQDKYRADFLTGVRYQMMHALVLVALAGLPTASRLRTAAAGLMTAGAIVFAGSLYVLGLTATPRWGAITPIGGLLLLAGWTCLIVLAVKSPPATADSSPVAR